jgi:hypothetical protein
MNTRTTSVLILAAALSASALIPLSAAPTSPKADPMAFSVRTVDQNGQSITRGASAVTVLRLLGAPHRKLSSDTWVYFGYRADSDRANELQCGTLVLTVVRGQVSDIKLVNDHAAQLIAANVKVKPAGMIAASK